MYDKIQRLNEESDIVGVNVLTSATIIFELAEADAEVKKHRSTMHPGFYFAGDNVDMRTEFHQMTMTTKKQWSTRFKVDKKATNGSRYNRIPYPVLNTKRERGTYKSVVEVLCTRLNRHLYSA